MGIWRAAVNSLQMLCGHTHTAERTGTKRRAKGDENTRPGKRKSGTGSRGGKGSKLDVSEDLRTVCEQSPRPQGVSSRLSLDAVTRREQSLGLFHALGKVLYNKRE